MAVAGVGLASVIGRIIATIVVLAASVTMAVAVWVGDNRLARRMDKSLAEALGKRLGRDVGRTLPVGFVAVGFAGVFWVWEDDPGAFVFVYATALSMAVTAVLFFPLFYLGIPRRLVPPRMRPDDRSP